MAIENLDDIPGDRPLTPEERKELFRELQEARCRLACSESMLEVALKSCKDPGKKKMIAEQLKEVREQIRKFPFAG